MVIYGSAISPEVPGSLPFLLPRLPPISLAPRTPIICREKYARLSAQGGDFEWGLRIEIFLPSFVRRGLRGGRDSAVSLSTALPLLNPPLTKGRKLFSF